MIVPSGGVLLAAAVIVILSATISSADVCYTLADNIGSQQVKAYDLIGKSFDRLTVLGRAKNRGMKVIWVCQCECGRISMAGTHDLTSGKHRSCGCLQKERVTKHGATKSGGWRTPEYSSWIAMKDRCLNPRMHAYHRYGGRGITISPRWLESFATFLEDMGPKPGPRYGVDRIDNDGNYEPGNCRWATQSEQTRNQTHNPRSWTGRPRGADGRFLK